jgi:hypothetical protein
MAREMTFSNRDIAKALAIVNIFETGRAVGSFSAVAVLDDGAGVSYGIGQFTHRSGSLEAVVKRFVLKAGDGDPLAVYLPQLRSGSKVSITKLARDAGFKMLLRAAGETREMREAQVEVLFERYLRPAIRICERKGFSTPLALAAIYDSTIHGHFEVIAETVKATDERAWVAEYVERRDLWLQSIPRLRKTRYRTKFFLEKIKKKNWQLDVPVIVNGTRLDLNAINILVSYLDPSPHQPSLFPATQDSADGPAHNAANENHDPPALPTKEGTPTHSRPPNENALDVIERSVNDAAEKYDRVEAVVRIVTTRTDSAKSLWTTVVGTVWQVVWAIVGLAAGIPREVWLVAAIVAGTLAAIYLYRQLVLGRIRETHR